MEMLLIMKFKYVNKESFKYYIAQICNLWTYLCKIVIVKSNNHKYVIKCLKKIYVLMYYLCNQGYRKSEKNISKNEHDKYSDKSMEV